MQGHKILALLRLALAEIGFRELREASYDRGDNKIAVPIAGVDALTDGILLVQTGTLHNLRFFSPYVDRKFDESGTWYEPLRTLDSSSLEVVKGVPIGPEMKIPESKHRLAFLLCRLFTSPAGNIATSTTGLSNMHNIFKNLMVKSVEKGTQSIDVKMLAAMLFCLMHRESGITGAFRHTKYTLLFTVSKSNHRDTVYEASLSTACADKLRTERVAILQTLMDAENDPADHLFDSRTLLKAFLCLYLEGQQSLSVLYTEYYQLGRRLGLNLPEGVMTASDTALRRLLLRIEKASPPIPYKLNTELPWRAVKLHCGDDVFRSGETFSNCAESALYYLCNCMLWDGDTRRYLTIFRADGTASVLSTKVFTGEMKRLPDDVEARKWHTLVENLPNAVCGKGDSVKFTDLIDASSQSVFYARRHEYQAEDGSTKVIHNEVTAGVINLFKVLEVLAGREGEFIPKIIDVLVRNDSNEVDIDASNARLQTGVLDGPAREVFALILGPDHGKNFTVSFADAKIEKYAGRHDIYGELRVTRRYPKAGFSVDYALATKIGHTGFKVFGRPVNIGNIDTVALTILGDRAKSLDLRYLLFRYLEPYLQDPALFADFRAEAEAAADPAHFGLTCSALGADECTRDLLDRWTVSALSKRRSDACTVIEYILKSTPVDDAYTCSMLRLPLFLLRNKLKPVPYITGLCRRSGSMLQDMNLSSAAGAHTWDRDFLTELNALLESEFAKSGGDSDRPETVSISTPDIADGVRNVFSKYRTVFSGTVVPVFPSSSYSLFSFCGGSIGILLKFLLAYEVIVKEKIEKGATLTKYEYGHLISVLPSAVMVSRLSSFLLGRPQVRGLIDELFAEEKELADGLRVLSCFRENTLVDCDVVLDVSTDAGELVLYMLLVYDLQFADSGLKEHILESQRSESARARILGLYGKYCSLLYSRSPEVTLHWCGIRRDLALGLAMTSLCSYLSLLAKNGFKLASVDITWLKRSQDDFLTCANRTVPRAENLASFRASFLSLYRSLLDMHLDDSAGEEHERVAELINITGDVGILKKIVSKTLDRLREKWRTSEKEQVLSQG